MPFWPSQKEHFKRVPSPRSSGDTHAREAAGSVHEVCWVPGARFGLYPHKHQAASSSRDIGSNSRLESGPRPTGPTGARLVLTLTTPSPPPQGPEENPAGMLRIADNET